MNIIISGHHVEVTPALRSYVEDKLASIGRHFAQSLDVRVLLSVESSKDKSSQHKVECNIRMKGQDIMAQNQSSSMYAAIDGLIDKLDRQVEKYKQKYQPVRSTPTGQLDH